MTTALRRKIGLAAVLAGLLGWALPGVAQESPRGPSGEALVRWPYYQQVRLPKPGETPLTDFVLLPSVFDGAKEDLADLRLYAGAREVPFALRVREPKDQEQAIAVGIFNRTEGPDGSIEASLDLGEQAIEHNEVQVDMPGMDFRRRAVLEGSTDAQQWRQLDEEPLVRFDSDRGQVENSGQVKESGQVEDLRLSYPTSRFRYLRLRVYKDPEVDQGPVEISGAQVYRTVKLPGEMITLPVKVGPREPTRGDRAPASAWIIDLGGQNVPCSQIRAEFSDPSFARDYYLEALGQPGAEEKFRRIHSGVWQRKVGEQASPMVADFSEVLTSRLRLVVVDHENPPLDLRSVKFGAAARQVVFTRPEEEGDELKLYYGNADARAPYYDFARNLPEPLGPQPVRASLEARQANPSYVPKPLPLTERWPWLIYVVLGSVSLVLGGVIVSVAGRAIALHDARPAGGAGTPDDCD